MKHASRSRIPILLLGVFICSSLSAAHPGDTATVVQLLAQGNDFAEKAFDNAKALESYNAALALAPNNYDILWRMSRTYADIGELMPAKTDEEKQKQLDTYEKSLAMAKQAVAANPNGAMGYAREAIALGRIALFRGIWDAIDLVKQTKAACEKAIVLDSTEAVAYYVLGRTNAKVCEKPRFVRWPLGLGWANMDDAITNYEKAISLRPDFIMYRLDCARAYIENDDYAKAREHLLKIASCPNQYQDDDGYRKDAAELLEKIKNK